jgi:hypothetical protein
VTTPTDPARDVSGSGKYTVEWRDLQTRILGLAP